MTENEKKIFGMFAEGKYSAQIAEELGVSRQYICAVVKNVVSDRRKSSARIQRSCVYVNIAKYMLDNRISVRKLAREAGCCYQTMLRFLQGKSSPRYETLRKLSQYTGLTVNDLMVRRSDEEAEDAGLKAEI